MIAEDGHTLSIVWELWFDVDRYFGTNITDDDDSWINFYTIYNIDTNRVTAFYVLDMPTMCDTVHWTLTAEEEQMLREMMEEYCVRTTGYDMDKFIKGMNR